MIKYLGTSRFLYKSVPGRKTERVRERAKDRQTDRQRQTNRQTETQIEREIKREIGYILDIYRPTNRQGHVYEEGAEVLKLQ